MTVITRSNNSRTKKYNSGSIGSSDIAPSIIIILALQMPCLKARCERQLMSKVVRLDYWLQMAKRHLVFCLPRRSAFIPTESSSCRVHEKKKRMNRYGLASGQGRLQIIVPETARRGVVQSSVFEKRNAHERDSGRSRAFTRCRCSCGRGVARSR